MRTKEASSARSGESASVCSSVPERRPLPGRQHRRIGLGEEADGQSGQAAEGEPEVVRPRQVRLHRLGQAGALGAPALRRPRASGAPRPRSKRPDPSFPGAPRAPSRGGSALPFPSRRARSPASPSLPGRCLQRPRQRIGTLPGRRARAWRLLGVGEDDEEGLPRPRRFVGGVWRAANSTS